MNKPGSDTSASLESYKNATKQNPAPYIRNVPIGDDTLPANVANAGFTIVLPILGNPSYTRTFFMFFNPEGGHYAISIDLVEITAGSETLYTLPADFIKTPFKPGDKFTVAPYIWLNDVWFLSTQSVVYTVV
ncbi:hypothetical protein [Pseudomonas sp. DSP3-2-2]|uniref:hypothetical protein n=1 Tax=unclassified Pseudomonas TaxID=196821 RepID=UPI003CE94D09